MAHSEQRHFVSTVKDKFPEYFNGKKVLEVGSLNINGTLRDFFENSEEYIGVDLEEGPCVDVVGQGQDLDYDDNCFDIAISAECFEHNPYWKDTFLNMIRMSSGMVVFTCATEGRNEHGTARTSPSDSPFTVNAGWDYYKNLTQADFESEIDIPGLFKEYEFSVHNGTHDLYFWGLVK